MKRVYSSDHGKNNERLVSYYTNKLCLELADGDKSCLQMGIGDGLILESNYKRYNRFDVIEMDEKLIKNHVNLDVNFIKSKFENFRPESTYDIILGNHVLEHVDEPKKICRRVKTWLKKDGKVLFTVPNADSLHRRIGVEMGLLSRRGELNSNDIKLGHQRVFTLGELESIIEQSGFNCIYKKGYMLKLVSLEQMKDWSRELLDAIFEVSLTVSPEYCASLAFLCE